MNAPETTPYDEDRVTPDLVGGEELEVRRRAGLSLALGLVGSALAIAYLWRATSSGAPGDWLLAVVMGAVGGWGLVGLLDARTPLLIADELGVRVRLGREWRGLPWGALTQVVVEHREGALADGRLVLEARDPASALAGLDAAARRQVAMTRRFYGAPLAVPLALTTRASTPTLLADLRVLADGRTDVVELRGRERAALGEEMMLVGPPRPDAADDGEETTDRPVHGARGLGVIGTFVSRIARGRSHDVDLTGPIPVVREAAGTGPVSGVTPLADIINGAGLAPSAGAGVVPGQPLGPEGGPGAPLERHSVPEEARTPLVPEQRDPDRTVAPVAPLREARRGLRAEVTRDRMAKAADEGHVLEQRLVIDDTVAPVAGEALAESAEPVIGPQVAAARQRAGLGIDELSERTRIRPHVLESIEVDDFGPCGGDFYARGHLRTLARYLGLDHQVLLEEYDARYAHAPINARRVFEAELATGLGGGIRGTLGGPRWSLLVGAVLSLLLIWGVARFFTNTPQELVSPSPVVSDSAGLAANRHPITSPLTTTKKLTLHAVRADARVVVRDRTGQVVWSGVVHTGQTRAVAGLAPFKVKAQNAGSVVVSVAGTGYGRMGAPGATATRTLG